MDARHLAKGVCRALFKVVAWALNLWLTRDSYRRGAPGVDSLPCVLLSSTVAYHASVQLLVLTGLADFPLRLVLACLWHGMAAWRSCTARQA